MPLVIKDKVYEQLTEGLHNVIITKVNDLGVQETQFGPKKRLNVVFEAQDQTDKEGKKVDVLMYFTQSLHSKAALVKNLLTPLGISANNEFDVENLIGIKCQVFIQHKESDGKTYANVTAVLKNKGTAPAPAAESF